MSQCVACLFSWVLATGAGGYGWWLAPDLFLAGNRDLDHGAVRNGFRDRQTAFAVLFGFQQDLQGALQVIDRPVIQVGAELFQV